MAGRAPITTSQAFSQTGPLRPASHDGLLRKNHSEKTSCGYMNIKSREHGRFLSFHPPQTWNASIPDSCVTESRRLFSEVYTFKFLLFKDKKRWDFCSCVCYFFLWELTFLFSPSSGSYDFLKQKWRCPHEIRVWIPKLHHICCRAWIFRYF